jgi:hypothetical protein
MTEQTMHELYKSNQSNARIKMDSAMGQEYLIFENKSLGNECFNAGGAEEVYSRLVCLEATPLT